LLLLLPSSSSSLLLLLLLLLLAFPNTSMSPHLKQITISLNAVILFCVLSTRYEGTLSSVTLCFQSLQ
jgi:hypothetical protein